MAPDLLSLTLICICAAVGYAAYWYLNARSRNAPPGPMGFPCVGYAPFLSPTPFIDFAKMGKTLKSNIISMYLGPVFTVVLNDWDAVKAAFVDQDEIFDGRPPKQFVTNYHALGQDGEKHSIIALEGPKWKAQCDFLHDSLEELGVGTLRMEGPILDEISCLTAAILEEKGAPFDFFKLSNPTTSSIIAKQAFGCRWNPHSERYGQLMKGSDEHYQLLAGSPLQVFSWLRFIPGAFKDKWIATKAVLSRQKSFIRDAIKQHEGTYEKGRIRDFVDVYLRHMQGEGLLDPITFENEDDFITTVTTAFEAGGESTNAALEWELLFLLHHPEIQTKIHEELDVKIGSDRAILLSDLDFLPYTAGAVYEAFRLGGNSALGVPRSNIKETQLLRYRIPKRSMVLMNVYACHRNPIDWKYPTEFNPENWINDNGRFEIPECFLSFSAGRRFYLEGSRKCPARDLAKMMVFLILANLLNKFEFINPKGQRLPRPDEFIPGISARPKPFKVEAIPRL